MARRQPSTRALRRRLLRWFENNKRDMPWRKTRDPYRIWVSEIMLQQTRVQAVVPYYRRFVKQFPAVGKLARARSILRFWAGLGYYSRARNLHKTAKLIVKEHGGKFPRRLGHALKLPGIGPYTARAILSIAYGKRLAVVDGNVLRVLIRLFNLAQAGPNDRATLQPLADKLVSPSRPGDYNQALMELGSTLCLPRKPRCEQCPLESLCAARQAGVEQKIPRRRTQRERPRLTLDVFVVEQDGKVLLVREPSGYFSGLWHFPCSVGSKRRDLSQWGIKASTNGRRPVATIVHETTMRDLVLRVFPVRRRVSSPDRKSSKQSGATRNNTRWVRRQEASKLGIGAATRKILAALA